MKQLFTLSALIVLASAVSAQWSPDPAINTPVCLATGKSIEHKIAMDGDGGAFIAWKDYRAPEPDIYIQHLDINGVPQWTIDGLPLCTNISNQSTPSIVKSQKGAVIVAWSDWRSGMERDIYAQKVDSNGNILWTFDGAIVADKIEREHNERVTHDGAGGCIVVWEQQRTTDWSWDVWAQRLDSNGNRMWGPGGIAVVLDNANRINCKIQPDDHGGAFFVWPDFRNGVDYDLYGQHLDKNGNRLWGNTGKAICTASATQNNLKVDPDSVFGGIYVAWSDKRSGLGNDIYAQRVDSNGNSLWTPNGIPVCGAAGNQAAVDILSKDKIDGVILTWRDNRTGDYNIYAQRINGAGIREWPLDGVPICTAPTDQVNPNIAFDGVDGAIIAWQDSSGGTWDIRSQRVRGDGTVMWPTDGVWVGTASGSQMDPKNVHDGNGGSIYVFQDMRSGIFHTYAHHLSADGTPLLSAPSTLSGRSLNAWPNPFSENISVSLPASLRGSSLNVRVLDATGRCTAHLSGDAVQEASSSGTLQLADKHFPAKGIYLIQLMNGSASQTVKVVKGE